VRGCENGNSIHQQQQDDQQDVPIAIACPQAGAAAVLSFGGVGGAALANELDILNLPAPGTQHVIDDAGVLNKTTRKGLNDELSRLEVRMDVAPSQPWVPHNGSHCFWHPSHSVHPAGPAG